MDVHLPRLFKTILQLLNLKIEAQLRQIDFEDIGKVLFDFEIQPVTKSYSSDP